MNIYRGCFQFFEVIRVKDRLRVWGLHDVVNFSTIITMKKLLFLFVLVSHVIFAQELDSLSNDSVDVIVPKHVLGAYALGGLGITPNPPPSELGLIYTVGVGVRYDKMEAGFTISTYGTRYERRLIFPNVFNLLYRHGGAYFSYRIFETDNLGFAPFGSFQVGDMVWERTSSGDDFLRDEFNLFQIGVKIDFPLLQQFEYMEYARPEVMLGYQTVNNLELAGVSNLDFSGFFIGFNVKLGYFNQ